MRAEGQSFAHVNTFHRAMAAVSRRQFERLETEANLFKSAGLGMPISVMGRVSSQSFWATLTFKCRMPALKIQRKTRWPGTGHAQTQLCLRNNCDVPPGN